MQQTHGMTIALAWCLGIWVGEVIVISLCKEFSEFLLHWISVSILVGKDLRCNLIQLHWINSLVEMISLPTKGKRLQSLWLTRYLNRSPSQFTVKWYLVKAERVAVRHIDVRSRELCSCIHSSPLLLEGVSVIISRY